MSTPNNLYPCLCVREAFCLPCAVCFQELSSEDEGESGVIGCQGTRRTFAPSFRLQRDRSLGEILCKISVCYDVSLCFLDNLSSTPSLFGGQIVKEMLDNCAYTWALLGQPPTRRAKMDLSAAPNGINLPRFDQDAATKCKLAGKITFSRPAVP